MVAADATLSFENVQTIGECVTFVSEEFEKQIRLAEEQRADVNTACHGDSEAKDAFLTLLPMPEQRAVFLRFLKRTEFWPRIRTLVGSPPFGFLRAEDNDVLRAGGIALKRANMSTEAADAANQSYASFGNPHFVDASQRQFKAILADRGATTLRERSELRVPFRSLRSGVKAVFEVRLKKRSLRKKVDIARGRVEGVKTNSIVFPRPGEQLTLQPSKRLEKSVDSVTLNVQLVQNTSSVSVATVYALVG